MRNTVLMPRASHSAILLAIVAGTVFVIALGLVLYVSAMRTTINVSSAVMSSQDGLDNAPMCLAANEASDYFQRHLETLKPVSAGNLDDYLLRHPTANGITITGDRYVESPFER